METVQDFKGKLFDVKRNDGMVTLYPYDPALNICSMPESTYTHLCFESFYSEVN